MQIKRSRICKKCQLDFQSNSANRLYCFSCTPFKNKYIVDKNLPIIICIICKKEYNYRKKSSNTKTYCSSCRANVRKISNKIKAIEYKGGKCSLCGYNRCIQALQFHHKDPTTKSFQISSNHGRRWEVIKEELDKCILICSNCHAELHAGLYPEKDDGNTK